jgi:hypothetical protein
MLHRARVDGNSFDTPCDATCQVLTGESKDLQAAEYRKFEEECIQAFNLIRKHSARLINLFQLVRSVHSCGCHASCSLFTPLPAKLDTCVLRLICLCGVNCFWR